MIQPLGNPGIPASAAGAPAITSPAGAGAPPMQDHVQFSASAAGPIPEVSAPHPDPGATAAGLAHAVTVAVGLNAPALIAAHQGYTALVLTDAARKAIFSRFTPQWKPVCDHVTLAYGVPEDTPLPPSASVQAIGYATDGKGVEALVVQVDGQSRRPDGSTYHVTLSLGDGRQAVESNDVIAHHGYSPIDPINLPTEPRFIPFEVPAPPTV